MDAAVAQELRPRPRGRAHVRGQRRPVGGGTIGRHHPDIYPRRPRAEARQRHRRVHARQPGPELAPHRGGRHHQIRPERVGPGQGRAPAAARRARRAPPAPHTWPGRRQRWRRGWPGPTTQAAARCRAAAAAATASRRRSARRPAGLRTAPPWPRQPARPPPPARPRSPPASAPGPGGPAAPSRAGGAATAAPWSRAPPPRTARPSGAGPMDGGSGLAGLRPAGLRPAGLARAQAMAGAGPPGAGRSCHQSGRQEFRRQGPDVARHRAVQACRVRPRALGPAARHRGGYLDSLDGTDGWDGSACRLGSSSGMGGDGPGGSGGRGRSGGAGPWPPGRTTWMSSAAGPPSPLPGGCWGFSLVSSPSGGCASHWHRRPPCSRAVKADRYAIACLCPRVTWSQIKRVTHPETAEHSWDIRLQPE